MFLSTYELEHGCMLRDSTTAIVVVVVVRMRPRAIPLAMIHMRKSIHGFPFVPLYGYGAPLGGLWPPELRYNIYELHCLLINIFSFSYSLDDTKNKMFMFVLIHLIH